VSVSLKQAVGVKDKKLFMPLRAVLTGETRGHGEFIRLNGKREQDNVRKKRCSYKIEAILFCVLGLVAL